MKRLHSRPIGQSLDAVTREHQELSALRDRVTDLLAAHTGGTGRSRLGDLLSDLHVRLQEHFALEEGAGLFEHLEEELPEAGRECDRLRGDHASLLARLARLREEVRDGAKAEGVRPLKASLGDFLEDLARHEERENALISRVAEGDEVGALD